MIELIQTYFIASLIIYFLPFIISIFTGNRTGSVFVMNLFLGWTFIGWVWALVWSVTPERKGEQITINNYIPSESSNSKSISKTRIIEQNIDKAPLLNQLSQLHLLKQNNVITEEIYEKERQEILMKFQPQKDDEQTVYTPTEQERDVQNDLEYQRLFIYEPMRRRRKVWIISLSIISLLAIGIYLLFKTSNEPTDRMENSTEMNKDSVAMATNSISKTKYKVNYNGTYSFLQDFECAIASGNLQINNSRKDKFIFVLSVAGSDNGGALKMDGKVEGVAKFISQNVAIFSNKDCEKLQFTFFNDGTVRVHETNCMYYHGTGICFDASFINPEHQ